MVSNMENTENLNLDKMSLSDLENIEQELNRVRQLKIKQGLFKMRDEFLAYCKANNIDPIKAMHLMGFSAQGYLRKTKPKYQDPVTGAYWAGRGKTPKWFKERIKAGYTEKDLENTQD
ncbi:H-NS histone family protein [Moraxella catarrhalis]|nr:H-NS histone family protein [Moraxella catarrhalis]